MNRIVYLRNGEEVELIEELSNGKFLVERYYNYEQYDGTLTSELSGSVEIVDNIYLKAPVQTVSKDAQKELEDYKTSYNTLKNDEAKLYIRIQELKNEIAKLEKTKTDFSNYIFNYRDFVEAKRIVAFVNYTPVELKTSEEYAINLHINYSDGKLSYEVYDCGGKFLCGDINKKYGLLINPSDEDIIRIGKKIVKDNENTISDTDLSLYTKDEYLTDKLLKRKALYRLNEIERLIEESENNISRDKEYISSWEEEQKKYSKILKYSK